MKVDKKDVYGIKLTRFPVFTAQRCEFCGDYFIHEKMWRWVTWRLYRHIHYLCTHCAPEVKDVVKFIERVPVKPPIGRSFRPVKLTVKRRNT